MNYELVHDAKAEEAARINNEGRHAQIAYLRGLDSPSSGDHTGTPGERSPSA